MKKDSVTLAFFGDAVYELAVRRALVLQGGVYAADKLHRAAVRYVKASAQAKAMRAILAMDDNGLDEEALAVVRRARNHKPKTVPKNADPVDYKMATALEALIGYLSLEGLDEKAGAVIDMSMKIIDDK